MIFMEQNRMKNNLIKSASIYTIGNFLIKGLAIITVPIFTRLLSESDYGYFSIYTTWSSLIAIFIGLGINGTIGAAKSNLDDEYEQYLSSVLFLSTLSFFVIFILAIIFKNYLSNIMSMSEKLIPIIIIQSFLAFVINFYYANLTFKKEPSKFMKLSLVTSILNIILSILFILMLKDDKYLGKVYAAFIVNFIFGIIIYFKVMTKGKVLINKKYWKFCLPIAIPIIFHSVSHLLLNQADRIMLQQFVGESAVGIYSFTYTVGTLLNMVNMSINSAWVAWYFDALKYSLINEIKDKAKIYIAIFTVFTSLFLLGSPEVVKILTPKSYWNGIPLLPLIIVGYYFVFLYTFGVNYEFYKKKTIFIAIGTIISGLMNIAINIILIPKIGVYAAAISTLIAYAFLFILHEFIVRIILKHRDFSFLYYIYGIIYISLILICTYILLELIFIRWCLIIVITLISIFYLNKIFNIINLVKSKMK